GVEEEELAAHDGRQPGNVPAPYAPGRRGDELVGPAMRRWPRATAVRELVAGAQQAVDRALGSQEGPVVGEHRHDLLWRQVAEARRVDALEEVLLLGGGEPVRGRRRWTCALVLADVLLAPALQRARIETELLAREFVTRACLHSFVDETEDQ